MAKKFRDLVQATMSPAAIERAHARTEEMLRDIRLAELRRARSLSQQELADRLSVKQPKVSEMERRADMYVSTLRKYIEAVGGELVIVARFPEGDIRIQQFDDLDQPHEHGSKRVTASRQPSPDQVSFE